MPAPQRFRAFGRPLAGLILALGSAAITVTSLVYFNDDELPPFVIEKLPLPFEELWLGALRLHVVAAAFALPACLLLSTAPLLRRAPRLHRWLGRATGVVVLFALTPTGFYLSLFAKGGLPATVGFMLSGAIVVVAMVQAVRTARAGDFVAHRRNTLHVLAQLSVAVTSRAMLFAFDAANVDPDQAYLVSLWLPVVVSAVAVELLVPRRPAQPRRDHEPLPAPRVAARSLPGIRNAA
jgi:uncharacterized membrane protein